MHALYAVSPRTIELQAGAEAASASEVACGKRGTSPHHWQPAHLHLRRHAPTPISSISSARERDLRGIFACSNEESDARVSSTQSLPSHSVQWMSFWRGSQKTWHSEAPTSSFQREEHATAPTGKGGGGTIMAARSPPMEPPQAMHPLQRHVVHASGPGAAPHVGCSQLSNGKSPSARDTQASPRAATTRAATGAGARPGG